MNAPGLDLICYRCSAEIRLRLPVEKCLRTTGERVWFHEACWMLIEQSSAEKEAMRLFRQRQAERPSESGVR